MVDFNLLMLVPPFLGSSAASYMGVTDGEGYIKVDWTMRVKGQERIYAVGDCVSFVGPKMGHMAVRQGEVAAANLAAQIEGHEPISQYIHEMRFVIDEGRGDGLYLHKELGQMIRRPSDNKVPFGVGPNARSRSIGRLRIHN